MNIDAGFFDFLLKFLLPFGSALALVALLVYRLSKTHKTH